MSERETKRKREYVIAGTYAEFLQWAHEERTDGVQYVYVSQPESLQGLENPTLHWIGTWGLRPDANQMREVALTRMRPTPPTPDGAKE